MKRPVFIAWLALLASAGCDTPTRGGSGPGGRGGDGGSTPVTYPPGSFGAACQGKSTQLIGTAYAPNGNDPVALAHIYVVRQIAPIVAGVACEVCGKSVDSALAEAIAAPDGKFTLSLDKIPQVGTVKLVISKGRFRRVTEVPVSACAATSPPKTAVTLPGRSVDGDLPKIAVATGTKDHLDVVLDALGVREFDCYDGTRAGTSGGGKTPCASTTTDIATLLGNPAKLATYNMLFLGCAPGKFAMLDAPTVTKNLEAWVRAGGRLFATDQSYNYIEQTFPPFIDFYPGGGALTAQPVDQANVGVGASASMGGASYSGAVTDLDLEAWLQAVGVLPPEANTLTLNGFLNPWSAQKDVAMGVHTEVTATAAYYTTSNTGAGAPTATASMPMTVQWDYQMCGRVLYSSYHTLATTQQGSQLSAQEKILEYLMLDIGSCVGPIM